MELFALFQLDWCPEIRNKWNGALVLNFIHVKVGNIIIRRAHHSGHGMFLASCGPSHRLGSQNGSRNGGQRS